MEKWLRLTLQRKSAIFTLKISTWNYAENFWCVFVIVYAFYRFQRTFYLIIYQHFMGLYKIVKIEWHLWNKLDLNELWIWSFETMNHSLWIIKRYNIVDITDKLESDFQNKLVSYEKAQMSRLLTAEKLMVVDEVISCFEFLSLNELFINTFLFRHWIYTL